MSVEIVTSGGGEALSYILNAVAAITGGSSYISLIKISLAFGVIWVSFRAAFAFPIGDSLKWFMGYLVLYNAMLLPKETVLITDKFDPAFHRVVDNVPVGITKIGSYTSQIGIGIAELFDQSFSLPDDMQYSKNGFLFGTKLLEQASRLKIRNAEFGDNMNKFIIQCIFYDIAFNKYTVDELRSADDLWNFMINDHNQSKLRMFTYNDHGNRQYVTCDEGSKMLATKWHHEIDNQMTYLFRRNFSTKTSSMAAANYISAYFQTASNYLMDNSKSAADTIRQNLMLNAINDASYDYNSTSVSNYSDLMSNSEAISSFQRIASQAEEWIPLLRTVFEAILYGIFPFLFLIFLLPVGYKVFMGYVGAFIWIESWPPLYAILHLLMTLYNKSKLSIAEGGQTINNITILNDINDNTALIAGAMMMSIPYISLKLLPFAQAGFAGIGQMAGSILAPASTAASSVAHEVSRGNFSAGTSSFDTHSFDTATAHKFDQSFMNQNYGGSLQNSDGSITKFTGDRSEHIDTSAMQSTFTHDMKTSMSISDALQQRAGISSTMGHNLEQESLKYQASSIDTAAKMAHLYSQGKESGEGWTKGVDSSTSKAFDQINAVSDKYGYNVGINAGGSYNKGGKGFGGKIAGMIGINAGANYEHSNEDQKRMQDSINIISKSSQEGRFSIHDSEGKSLNEELNASYTKYQQLSDKASSYYNEAKNLSNEATRTKSLEGTVTTNEATGFYDWMRNQGYSRQEVVSVIENPDRIQTFQMLSNQYMQNRVDSLYSADYGKNLMNNVRADNGSYAKQSFDFSQQHAGDVMDRSGEIKSAYNSTKIDNVEDRDRDNSELMSGTTNDIKEKIAVINKKKEE
jgi:conjugal transfer mating pair stabilization protein TraG